jgi:hypothetical protein
MTDEFYQMIKGVSEAATEPVCKLIEAVRASAGMVYQPVHVKRMAAAKAEALVIRAEADLKLTELRERAAARLTNTETRRQENIESIVQKAYENLPGECSEKPIDKDWIADFFDSCKDVGSEEVQALWGKLLAGEVADSGSYSRRALNTLKLMSSTEAALFDVISYRVWKLDGWPVLVVPSYEHEKWSNACPFKWAHIGDLGDIGLLEPKILSELSFIDETLEDFTVDYFGERYVGRSTGGWYLRWINFSHLGAELLPVVAKTAGIRDAYFDACKKRLSSSGWRRDETSDFRAFDMPADQIEALNLNHGD